MAERCPACGGEVPRGAGFCPACGTAMNTPDLPFEGSAVGSAVSEREVALGANRPNAKRAALVVAGVAVLLVGGGLIVGAGGGGDDESQAGPTPSATTTTAPRPTTTEDRPARTTVPRTNPPPTLPSYAAQPMAELGGLPVYAVADSRVIRIDTATGQSVILGQSSRAVEQGATLLPRAGGVVVTLSQEVSFFPDDGSSPVSLGLGEAWPAADPALVWAREFTSNGSIAVRLIRAATGEEVARPTLPVFSYPLGDDGTGLLLADSRAGGTFAIDPATGVATRVSDAAVVAATASHLLLLRCDDALVCSHELVDRPTGGVTAALIDGTSPDSNYVLDPTGTRVAIFEYDFEGASRTRLVELGTGAQVELDLADNRYLGSGGAPVSWTPDGQHVVGVLGSSVVVWTPSSGQAVEYPVTDVDGDRARVVAAAVGFPSDG